MTSFGWSYPAGCESVPDDEPYWCDICGRDDMACTCPECPECGDMPTRDCCGKEGHLPHLKPSILDIHDLCLEVTGSGNRIPEECYRIIAKTLYKSTRCGVSFWSSDFYLDARGYVTISGYCEGDVGDCFVYTLEYPFTAKEFWDAVQAADDDGVALWNETHGCDTCREHWNIDEECFSPIWDSCPTCQGAGEIL